MKLQFKVFLRCALAMFLMMPIPVWADHVPTQEPYGYNESINTETGALTLSILSSDGFEDSPPEKYTIFFAMASGVSTSSFCVSTSFGHVTNTWQDYVFSISDLRTYFELPVGTFYYRIRSDNDTDNSFSTLSSERSIALPNQAPFSDSQTDWSAPTNTCNDTATTTTTTTTTTTVPDTTTTSSTSSTTTTSSSTTTTTTTSSTTTTTLPPPPPPPPTTTTTLYIVVNDDGSESEYTETEVEDGTVKRDEERKENEKLYGCYMTSAQIERGDCDIPEEKEEETIIIIEDEKRDDTEEKFFNDDDLVLELDNADETEEFIELTEEEILELEKQMELDAKALEMEEELKILEFDSEEEAEEYIEVVLEVEEFLEDLEDIEIEIIEIEEIKDIEIIIIEDEEILDEEIITDDTTEDRSMEMEDVFEDRADELGRDTTGTIKLSEEELEKEIEELEEVVVIEEIFTEEISEEELEQLSEEEILEYEEAKEEAIEQYVEELETEEVIEVLEEVNDIGLNNIAEVSEDVIEVVAQVVEEVITIAQEEELTEEQVEVVAEVLGFEETEDVEIIAEAVKTDENVAQAVDEFVERAVENKDVENYTLADATTEIAFETFVADPISVIIDVDLENITLNNITSDMTQDQKEKAQEVIVPTLLVKIASLAFRRFN